MKGDQAPRPRIIVKKAHGGHHGGAWKVAYADFVTTMMALFIVLWITSQNAGTREAWPSTSRIRAPSRSRASPP
jgi:chemotaxis protein MotB